MLDYLARHWWIFVVRGALAVLFGIVAIVWPGITLSALAVLFGVYAFVEGGAAAVSAYHTEGNNRIPLALEAAVGVVLGLLVLLSPGAGVVVLAILIGTWAILTGALEVVAAVKLREEIEGEWRYILGGALSVFFGLLVWFWPTAGAVVIAFIIGIYAIVFGVVLIALGMRVRREQPQAGPA